MEVQGSLELQNGGLRTLEEGRMTTFPGQSCKEEGFLDFLSVPNRAQMSVTRVMLTWFGSVFIEFLAFFWFQTRQPEMQ